MDTSGRRRRCRSRRHRERASSEGREAIWLITFGPETLWRSEDGEELDRGRAPRGVGTWGFHARRPDQRRRWGRPADQGGFTRRLRPGRSDLDRDRHRGSAAPDITVGRWRRWTLATRWRQWVRGSSPGQLPSMWIGCILESTPADIRRASGTRRSRRSRYGAPGAGPLATLKAEVTGRQTMDRSGVGEQVHEIVVNDQRIDPTTFVEDGLIVGEYQIAVVDEQGVVTPGVVPWGG